MSSDHDSDSLTNDLSRLRLRVAIERLLCGMLVCFVVVRVLVPGEFSGLGPNLFISTLFVFVLVLTGVLAAIDGSISILWDKHLFMALLFGLAVLVSPFVADYEFGALNYAVGWLVPIGLFLLLVSFQSCEGPERNPVRFAVCALFATAVSVGVIALLQWSFGFAEMQREIVRNPTALDFLPSPLLHEFHVRLHTNEPYACFTNPNSLAGFLVLIVPALIALAGARRADDAGGGRRSLAIAAKAFLCVLALALVFVIGLTGSRGGIGAFLVALLVLFVGVRVRARRKVLLALAVVGLCAAVVVFALSLWTNFDPLDLKNPGSSMGVRVGYWRATLRMTLERPVLGVGLDNFAGHYLRLKDALAGETIRAHNDYLNIGAELGIPSAVFFLLFWIVLVWRGLRPEEAHAWRNAVSPREAGAGDERGETAFRPTGHSRLTLLYCAGGGIAGWLLTWTFSPSVMLAYGIPQVAAWLLAFAACHLAVVAFADGRNRLFKIGVVAGLCGLLAHSLMEFNFYVHGIALAVWLLASIAYADNCRADARKAVQWSLSVRARAISVALLLAVFTYLAWSIVPDCLEAEDGIECASQKMAGDESRPAEIVERLEKAAGLCPGNPHAWHQLAVASHRYGCSRINASIVRNVLKEKGEEGVIMMFRTAHDTCAVYAGRAVEADQTASKLQYLLGVFEAEHAAALRLHGQVLGADARATLVKAAEQRELAALMALETACRLYPTSAENRYQYGLALERAGRTANANREYREALRLHELQKLPRLRLDDKVVEELEKRIGR